MKSVLLLVALCLVVYCFPGCSGCWGRRRTPVRTTPRTPPPTTTTRAPPTTDPGRCTANLCSTHSVNLARGCDPQGCGQFGASRGGVPGAHKGWDVKCSGGDKVFAPFDGTLVRVARPYGNGKCCDTGFLITGTGNWAGHSVKMFYSEPIPSLIGTSVTKGQHIADHVGVHCPGCHPATMTDHTHYQLELNGAIADPGPYLFCDDNTP